jgi:dolichyl-phosphate-mannose-protein mannosyltransferase
VAGGEAGHVQYEQANNGDHPNGQHPAAAGISGAPPPPGQRILSKEERVEYRDQDGNLLDPEQVKALEGKVEFKTRYETRTRVVDELGNELQMPDGGWPNGYSAPGSGDKQAVAPPHPDVEGGDPATKKKGEVRYDDPLPGHGGAGADAESSMDGKVEAEESKPKPASEGNEATPSP